MFSINISAQTIKTNCANGKLQEFTLIITWHKVFVAELGTFLSVFSLKCQLVSIKKKIGVNFVNKSGMISCLRIQEQGEVMAVHFLKGGRCQISS